MRVASAGLYRQVLDAIGRNQSDVARLQLQVATGRRMLAPADDPSGSVRSMHLRNAIDQLAQFQANGARAAQRLALEDNTLRDVVNTLQRVQELAVQSQNATETDETRAVVITELRSILTQVVQLANSTDGEGEYLFAGHRSNDAPFVLDASGVTYLGDQGQRMIQIGPSRQVADGDPGSDVFLDIPDGNGTFATSAAGANTGTGIIDTGMVTDASQWDGGSYTIAFTSATDYEVRDATNAVVATGTYTSDEPNVIAFRGVQVSITGAPAAGDAFQVDPSASRDVFATIEDFIEALEAGAVSDVQEAQLHNRLNGVMASLDQAFGHLVQIQARVGTRMNAVDDQADMNSQYSILLEATASDIENVDMVEAVSALDLKLTTLDAAQQAFVAVQRLSLFNYL